MKERTALRQAQGERFWGWMCSCYSEHRPRRDRPLTREAEARFDREILVEDMRGDALSHRGAVLEPMPRPAADEPDALLSAEAVDQIFAVRDILILAAAPAAQRDVCEAGEAPRDQGASYGATGRGGWG